VKDIDVPEDEVLCKL